jgi:hypothetical protein
VSASTFATVSRVRSSESGNRCAYVFSVSTALACPRRACTVFTDSLRKWLRIRCERRLRWSLSLSLRGSRMSPERLTVNRTLTSFRTRLNRSEQERCGRGDGASGSHLTAMEGAADLRTGSGDAPKCGRASIPGHRARRRIDSAPSGLLPCPLESSPDARDRRTHCLAELCADPRRTVRNTFRRSEGIPRDVSPTDKAESETEPAARPMCSNCGTKPRRSRLEPRCDTC